MMEVRCAWCDAGLGWVKGPDGQVTHGICKPCQERQMTSARKPFSVARALVAALAFLGLLLVYGVAGESDRRDALVAEQLNKEIVASSKSWAVVK